MPKLKVMEDDALNAFASGLNEKQYSITVTQRAARPPRRQAEIEAVLGHELTHIRNGDVRMLVIAVIIAGVICFFAELLFRMMFQGGWRWGGGRSAPATATAARAAAASPSSSRIALVAVAWLLSVVIRFALSRKREYLADAGSVELTKNPDAMISALRKIEGRGELRRRDLRGHGDVHRQPARGLRRPVRHPSVDRKPRRGAGAVRRRPRSGPARPARGTSGRIAATDRTGAAGAWRARPLERRCRRLPKPFLPSEPPVTLGGPAPSGHATRPLGPAAAKLSRKRLSRENLASAC